MSPTLLDVCCGAGGASRGYADAGFDVVGIDLRPQPRYPYKFAQLDLRDVIAGAHDAFLDSFDVVHISPPCQTFTGLRHLRDAQGRAPGERADATLLLESLAWCQTLGRPWVVENVPGAPMPDPLTLCGSAFGLGVQRHRLFSSPVFMLSPGCFHGLYADGRPWGVFGRAGDDIPAGGRTARNLQHGRDVMGVDWPMTWRELTESIPPAFTRFIGGHLIGAT